MVCKEQRREVGGGGEVLWMAEALQEDYNKI